jgi:putative ABC transport system substrate-binding protein
VFVREVSGERARHQREGIDVILRIKDVGVIIVALAILIGPGAPGAQTPARVPTVGILSAAPAADPAASAPQQEAFERGLKELGWIPGQNVRLEYRYSAGGPERLEGLARDLVRLGVDVIVARATPSIRAATRVTATIPIVMSATGQDPIQAGFIGSLARPDTNVTGLTLRNRELQPKQLQLLKEVVPRLSRVAVLGGAVALPETERQLLETAAAGLDLQLQLVSVQRAGDLDKVFADLAGSRVGALLVRADPSVLEPNTQRLVALALKYRLPAVYWLHTYPRAGGLMSYGADLIEVHRRSAYYVDRLLRGARPADLPVEEPTRLSLVVNVKAARAIGLTLPPSILARVDEVIQ